MASRFLVPLGRGGDPLLSIYREMNRLFDDVLGGGFGAGRPGSTMSMPSLDVHEKDNEVCISAELPGVKASEVDVRLDGDVLTISGEKKSETDPKQSSANYHVMERSYGRFVRSVQLPFTPDAEQVNAEFRDGVLSVRLKRSAHQERSRRIEVRDSGSQIGQSGTSDAGRSAQASDPGRAGSDGGAAGRQEGAGSATSH